MNYNIKSAAYIYIYSSGKLIRHARFAITVAQAFRRALCQTERKIYIYDVYTTTRATTRNYIRASRTKCEIFLGVYCADMA